MQAVLHDYSDRNDNTLDGGIDEAMREYSRAWTTTRYRTSAAQKYVKLMWMIYAPLFSWFS